jgi:hypothetical protein
VRTSPPPYADGLFRLRDALAIISLQDRLTAANIQAAFAPGPTRHGTDSLPATLNDIRSDTMDLLLRRLDMPVWLATQYNLPAPYLDDDGALRLDRDNAPGQGGLASPFIQSDFRFDPEEDWLPDLSSLLSSLELSVNLASPPDRTLTLYQPFAWQPPGLTLASLWTTQSPHVQSAYTPSAVQEWLPQNLRAPEQAARTLDAILSLTDLPYRSGEDWLEATLEEALPDDLTLPPKNGAEWLQNWFTNDTLGVARMLDARVPDLPDVDEPVYDLGVNDFWR